MIPFLVRRLFRHKRALLAAFAIFILIFFLYQLLYLRQLGRELSGRRPRPKLQKNYRKYEKADGLMVGHDPKNVVLHDPEPRNLVPREPEPRKMILGVLAKNQRLYEPRPGNKFRCLRTGEEIEFGMVNDDYCDCRDYSDEPSTAACGKGRFYCSQQSLNGAVSIVSYKVNDGVCDCCDGSDEFQKVILPQHTSVPAKMQKGIFQAPCTNRCTS